MVLWKAEKFKGKDRNRWDGTGSISCWICSRNTKRGKCQTGQRTIYDSVFPAAQAAKELTEKNPEASLSEVVAVALNAAKEGTESTKSMVPVFGKAAVHAAQCAGIADQGAVAGYYKILGFYNYICGM